MDVGQHQDGQGAPRDVEDLRDDLLGIQVYGHAAAMDASRVDEVQTEVQFVFGRVLEDGP